MRQVCLERSPASSGFAWSYSLIERSQQALCAQEFFDCHLVSKLEALDLILESRILESQLVDDV